MSATTLLILMAAQHQHRMHEEEERRRRQRREEEERRRKEAERKRQEENRKMIEHRKNSPVICNNEEWQINRCVKAISMQSFVQELVSTIDMVRPIVIENEEKKYDKKILDVGCEYETVKNDLDSDIDTLRKLGISIDGKQYTLSRLTPINTNIAKPEQTTESFGNTFTINNEQPIELTPRILSSDRYYEDKYQELSPEALEKEVLENNLKMQKYQKYGKVLKFLLKTKKYIELEEESVDLKLKNEQCELRRKEMQSYKSLTKEQLLAIKSYFIHLDQLTKISNQITELFKEKASLRYESNEDMYDLTIKEIMSNGEYTELLNQVYDFISKIQSNDEETMKLAYELVKGQYPIEITRRYIYNLIIKNMNNYTKEDAKQLRLE